MTSRLRNKINELCKNEVFLQDLDTSNIIEIKVFDRKTQNNNLAEIEVIKYPPAMLCMNIEQQVATELLFPQSSDLYTKAKAIVIHELYHCKEICITSKQLKTYYKYFDDTDTTLILLLQTAIECWSEYYAYYYSAKHNLRNVSLEKYVDEFFAYKTALSNNFSSQTIVDMPENFYYLAKRFIRATITIAAQYHSTQDEKQLNQLDYCKNDKRFSELFSYYSKIFSYMENLFLNYPLWISEDNFIEIGKQLYSFIGYLNLEFASEDLSDNFQLRYK